MTGITDTIDLGAASEAEQFELLLDELTADRTGLTLAEVRAARRQQHEINRAFARRLAEDASEPGRDYAE